MITVQKGDRISEYVLEEPLGRGGFGEVWRARHHLWEDRRVAVKIPTTSDAVRDLTNEGVIQASLDHPGIAKTLGMDVTADPPYFITELVDGTDLRSVLRERGHLPPEEVLELFDRILEVLDYAHTQGIVHQDIKPENILLTPDGRVKLTDFGLGQTMDGESLLLSASLRSEQGRIGGTLAYIAPEVRDQSGSIDGRADLYSLGIVLFELLTGERPAGMELPTDLVADLPGWCDEVFRRLYTRRDGRYADVGQLRSRLREVRERLEAPQVRVTPLDPPERNLLTLPQAAQRLGLVDDELDHWVRQGALTPLTIGGRRYLPTAALASFRRDHPAVRSLQDRPTRLLGAGANGTASVTTSATRRRLDAVSSALAEGVGREARGRPLRSAGFWIRALALAIDIWVGSLAGVVAVEAFLIIPPLGVPGLLAFFAYFALCTGFGGQTLGKAALGIRVVRQDGGDLTVVDGIIRTINYALSAAPLGFGFILAAWNERKLAIHDMTCGTRVVHVRGRDSVRA